MELFGWMKRYAFVLFLLLAFIVGLYTIYEEDNVENEEIGQTLDKETPYIQTETEEETNDAGIVVDIKGEVEKPGVYEVHHGARIIDIIALAGGFTKHADELQVNLAQIVQDEMIIYVPKVQKEVSLAPENITQTSFHHQEQGVKINTASQEELETLPGIGPAKAEAIIQYREENGPFQSKEDLLNVSGIGEKTLTNMEDMLIVP